MIMLNKIKEKVKGLYKKIFLLYLIFAYVLLIIEYITRIILRNSIELISWLSSLVTISIIILFVLFLFKNKEQKRKLKSYYNESRTYLKGMNLGEWVIGWLISFTFLILTTKNPNMFITLSSIYFTITGFSFTSGAFFSKKNNKMSSEFFRISVLFAILGFLQIILFLFLDIIIVVNNTYSSIILAVFVLTTGFLFWVAFRKLIITLIKNAHFFDKKYDM